MVNIMSILNKINSIKTHTELNNFRTIVNEAIEKRELIKVSVLKNCADDPREIAEMIGERTHSQVVKVIGKKMIFFRQAKKNSKYNLPD